MGAVTLQRLDEFDARAKTELGRVGPLDVYVDEHHKQMAAPYAVCLDGERVGSILLFSEMVGKRKELVVAATVADAPEGVLLPGVDAVSMLAAANGFKTVRCQTERPALVRRLMNHTGGVASVRWGVSRGW